jgi:hypothetical protein
MAAIMAGDSARPMMEPMNMPLYTRDRLRLRSATGTHLQQQQQEEEGKTWFQVSGLAKQTLLTFPFHCTRQSRCCQAPALQAANTLGPQPPTKHPNQTQPHLAKGSCLHSCLAHPHIHALHALTC